MKRWRRVLACMVTLAMVCVGMPNVQGKSATTKLNKTKVVLYVGKTAKLKVNNYYSKKVTWSSSKKTVVSVSRTGKLTAKVKAKRAGTAKVYAKCGKKRLVCNITVKSARISMESQDDVVVEQETEPPKPTAAVLTAKNASGKTKYLADQTILYEEEWDVYHFQFSVKLSDKKTRAKYGGQVEFEIINEAEESVYHQSQAFEKTDFTVKASDQAGGYLCDIEIPREEITEGAAENGVIYYTITLSDETWFRKHFLEIDTLPICIEEELQETVVPYRTKEPVTVSPTLLPTEEPEEDWLFMTEEPEETDIPTIEPEWTPECPVSEEPTESPEQSATPTVTETATPTESPVITVEPTESVEPSEEPTMEPSPSLEPTESPVVSATPEVTATPTLVVTVTPEVTATPTLVVSPTASVMPTVTPTIPVTPSPMPNPFRDKILEDSMEQLKQFCAQQGEVDAQGNYCFESKIGVWTAKITYLSWVDGIYYEISAPIWDYDDVVLTIESRPYENRKSSIICRCSSERLGTSGVGLSLINNSSFQQGQLLQFLQNGTVTEMDLETIGNIYLGEGCRVWTILLREIGLDLSMLGYDNIYAETLRPVVSKYPMNESMDTSRATVSRWIDYLIGFGEYEEEEKVWVVSYRDASYEYRMLYLREEQAYSYQVRSLTEQKEFRLEWAEDKENVNMFFHCGGEDVLQAYQQRGSFRKSDTIPFESLMSFESMERAQLQAEANQYLQTGYEGWEKLAQCAGLSLPQIGLDGLYQ